MVWGFNRKATAEAASAITRQRPPSQWMQPATPGQGMTWVVKTIGDGLPAMTEGPPIVPGKAKCQVYKIDSADELNQLLRSDIIADTPAEIDVYNLTAGVIGPGVFLRATQVGGSFVVDDASPVIIFATLDTCLLATDTTVTVTLQSDGVTKVSAKNLWHLDGVQTSLAELKLDGDGEHVIDEVRDRIAKHANGTVTYTGGSPNVTPSTFYEGSSPMAYCPPDWAFSCTPPCDLTDECFHAHYDPESHTYVIDQTASSLLGTPSTVNTSSGFARDGCQVNFSNQPIKAWTCGAPPAALSFSLKDTDILLSRFLGVQDDGIGGKEIQWQDYYVPVCASTPGPLGKLCLKTECPEQVYTVAQYAEIHNVASEIVSLDQTWTPIVGYEAETYPARGINVNLLLGTMSWANKGIYAVNVYLNMVHDESNQSRETQLRMWSVTDGAQVGETAKIGLARNQSATVVSVPLTVEIDDNHVGDSVVLEIGAGDNIAVTFFDISFGSFSVGEYRS